MREQRYPLAEVRARRRYLQAENKKWPGALREIPRAEWPAELFPSIIRRCGVWRSREFAVQAFAEHSGCVRLTVNRADLENTGDWKGGITWDDLQRLKREAGFGDRQAVEIYPPDSEVINVANMRHLWILPEPLPWTLRNVNGRLDTGA